MDHARSPRPAAQSGSGSGAAEAVKRLNDEITVCRECPRLVEWRREVAERPPAAFRGETYWQRPLTGFGELSARLVVVGLAPAAHGGNRTGRMFTGDRSGDFLFAGLFRAGFANQAESRHRDDGLTLEDAYVTASVRCAPPQNRPTPTETARCRRFLARELELLEAATVYLALGAFAYTALANTPPILGMLGRPRPAFRHGLSVPLGFERGCRFLLCSYHPSQRNTFTGLLTPGMFDEVLGSARALIETTVGGSGSRLS